ncbi:hypothetical protein PEX1_098400 [Penicillium expansum]|uniref:Uncharacterized protein n=1 Tax=Penicillium expansum TaxID=27334 RepID=A0A0A2K801_PENEN|nr:hypothetical protein PEX2_067080 [Penicillium expansum]KGO46261.1 hypothetical protein PEXP_098730 [Penicillium expansum]KGO58198.1 hypothetical protein PEX2_067080 [Penicillium expansum]KGO63013.1 hypothetical protein PEX1_098400 [Penicillium expansum]
MCHGGKIILSHAAFAVQPNCTNLVSDISGRNMAFTYNKLLTSHEKGKGFSMFLAPQ